MLNVDLHSHSYVSSDCLMRPADIVRACQKIGIDRLAITDHNHVAGALEAHALAPDLVIVGEEILTTRGELLGYFVKERVPPHLTPAETIARLRAQGAAISVSHPFDRLRKGAWREADLAQVVPWVDAIEVFNARCLFPDDNARASAFAREHGLAGTVGSDAHSLGELGQARLLTEPFSDAAGFVAALRGAQGRVRPSPSWVHLWSRYASLRKRWQRTRTAPRR